MIFFVVVPKIYRVNIYRVIEFKLMKDN